MPPPPVRVLVVDDDPSAVRLMERFVSSGGWQVDCAESGEAAFARLAVASYDVVISDLSMPGMDGMQILREVRERDPDLQVILVTGAPTVGTAALAMEYGACLYVSKPLERAAFVRAVGMACARRRDALSKRGALSLLQDKVNRQWAELQLDASLTAVLDAVWMAYQPIVHAQDGSLFGYEALLRSTESSLPSPGAIIEAAERLGRLQDLGRAARSAAAAPISAAQAGVALFVNLHGTDIMDPELLDRTAPLSLIADRVVLEITERVSLDTIGDIRGKIADLRALGFRIAVDDLGAGYAGLASVAALEPEILKLDISLVRGVDRNQKKQALVRALSTLGKEVGSLIVAEGVETAEEREVLIGLGCDLLQGYFIARPGPPFPAVMW